MDIIKKTGTMAMLLRDCLSKDSRKRVESKMALLRAVGRMLGVELYKSNLSWPHDKEYFQVARTFLPNKEKHKLNVHDRKFTLAQFLKMVRDIPGDTAECGVYRGESSNIILKLTEKKDRYHYCFDSFEGLSRPSQKDISISIYGFKWKEHDLHVSEDETKKNLSHYKNVIFKKGWIPNRFSEVSDCRFSFVHIDVDLKQPTNDSLVFFYPRMSSGGIIIVDDYGFESCPGARKATDEFMIDKPEVVLHLTTGQGVIIIKQGPI